MPPVKETARTFGCATIPSPTTDPLPVSRFTTPGGNPDSSRTSTNFAPHKGVREEGLNTIGQPAMRAAPDFQLGIAIGKFQGVMRPTGPTGMRIVRHILFGSSEGTVSPTIRRPSPAAYSKKSIASWTSPSPSAMTFPISAVTRRPRSSFRFRKIRAASRRSSPRLGGGVFFHLSNAAFAAFAAAATSSFVPRGNVARVSPVAGLLVSNRFRPFGSTHFPSR